MSTAVAETSSHVSSQGARPRSGQTSQSSSRDGFSGLVDSNLTAANTSGNGNEASQQPERPRPAQRDASAGPQGGQRTGVRRKPQDQADSTRQATNGPAPVAQDAPPVEGNTPDAAATTLDAQAAAAAAAGSVGTNVNPDQAVAPTDGGTQDAKAGSADATAATDPTSGSVPGTGIVATAVTVQINLAANIPVPVIQPSDTIAVSNPPATIAAAPAGTAANALARVAADTANTQAAAATPSTGDTTTPSQAEAAAQAATATTVETAAAAATAAQTNVGTAQAAASTQLERSVAVETAAPPAQLTAKAPAELAATATKADPAKPADQPQTEQIVASTTPKAAAIPAPARDEAKATPEQPSAPKAETKTERSTETGTSSDDQSNRTPDVDARPAQRAPHEQTVPLAAHAQTASSEPQQATGFGLSQTTTLQTPASAVQTAQLTAVPVAANTPVPVSGLAVEISANAQIGRSRFEIRLDPPELGRIDVHLDVDQKGQVTSHLVVEKSATLDMLRRDAPQLERALQDAGLKTSDNGLQFSLRDQQQQQTGRNDDQGMGRNAQRLVVTDEDTVVAETAGRSYGRMASLRGGIDIRV